MSNFELVGFDPDVSLLAAGIGVLGAVLLGLGVIVMFSRRRSARNGRAMRAAGRASVNGTSLDHSRAAGAPLPRTVTREPYVSVVIPCYNEEGNIEAMHERLSRAIAPLTSTY